MVISRLCEGTVMWNGEEFSNYIFVKWGDPCNFGQLFDDSEGGLQTITKEIKRGIFKSLNLNRFMII